MRSTWEWAPSWVSRGTLIIIHSFGTEHTLQLIKLHLLCPSYFRQISHLSFHTPISSIYPRTTVSARVHNHASFHNNWVPSHSRYLTLPLSPFPPPNNDNVGKMFSKKRTYTNVRHIFLVLTLYYYFLRLSTHKTNSTDFFFTLSTLFISLKHEHFLYCVSVTGRELWRKWNLLCRRVGDGGWTHVSSVHGLSLIHI